MAKKRAKKPPSSKASITNTRADAKAVAKIYNKAWSVTNHAPLFLRRPKMVGNGKSKKRATYLNKKGEEVPIPQKANRCTRRFPLRVLLSAAAANAAETLNNDAKLMRSELTGEASVSGALPDVSRGAEVAIEYALIAYAQSAFQNALEIRDAVGMHKKVTNGAMSAGVNILNDQLSTCTGITPGVYLTDKKRAKAITKKPATAPEVTE